jgi:ubiquinone/menaquinone biosynthesis C-methylase UbiE
VYLHANYSTNAQSFYSWVFERLRFGAKSKVLEVGCGSGRLWCENEFRLLPSSEITLSDVSPDMLKQAKLNLGEACERFDLVIASAQALPFADQCFDIIIANHMLYHISNRASAYSEFRRVLKPGGRMYASTSGRESMKELQGLIYAACASSFETRKDPVMYNDRNRSNGFNLQRGKEELSPWFSVVEMHRYEDSLVVSDVQPLVAYARSTGVLLDSELVVFEKQVSEIVTKEGAVRIRKEVGLFEAWQAKEWSAD